MNKPAQVGHRRMHLRFEVIGMMPASIISTEMLQVLNVSESGVLVEGALPLPVNGEYAMQLVIDGFVTEVMVKVRRVMTNGTGLGARYRMGLEFLAKSAEATDVIDQIVQAQV